MQKYYTFIVYEDYIHGLGSSLAAKTFRDKGTQK